MQNLIWIALKRLFFLKYHQICPEARILPQNTGLWYALVAPVCSARCPIEAFCKKIQSSGYLSPPAPPKQNSGCNQLGNQGGNLPFSKSLEKLISHTVA